MAIDGNRQDRAQDIAERFGVNYSTEDLSAKETPRLRVSCTARTTPPLPLQRQPIVRPLEAAPLTHIFFGSVFTCILIHWR